MRVWRRGRLLALLAVPAAVAAAAHAGSQGGRVLSVNERDFHISAPGSIRGGTLTLRVHNLGPDTHELLIARAEHGSLPLRADGLTVDEDAIHPIVFEGQTRGKTGDLRVTLAPGRYVLFCNMAGHYLAGMHTTLVVR
jgi:uncharacterized cupredoxin-like copper-binding protein